ncbi:GFA family protein [Aliterella atlantica]|uniref:Aldehyde-activating protein n=1 Tax=Aliterella atlantica CENA595 TaxID=1618023 RepID=A0A0D9A1C3_9CYAN|nr:GFA family protein [Aliterella atlantica]KJH73256.1 aldehyde-activating protein [Aliterella atlantica CENA595]
MEKYEGGCHCGAVRFQVVVDKHKADECNCSICLKKGFLHLIVPKEKFTLLQGADVLTTYTFNTGVAKHTFCRICGIHSFYTPRSHPNGFSINVRCLDGDEPISRFEIVPFDGANWEQNIHKLHGEESTANTPTD